MRYRRKLLLVVLLLAGCSNRDPADKVTYVDASDSKMNAAIEQARSTADTFIAALQAPQPGQTGLSIKMAFTDGTNTEHMWLTDVKFDGTKFHGTVNNDPDRVKNVTNGQKASVARAEISDWMYVENGKLVGGYTLRVLRDGLSDAERADFDKSVPFAIE